MTAHDPSLGRHGGLLGWLGFGQTRALPIPDVAERHEPVRMRQLDEIGAFLGYHRLEINASTLSVAWCYLTGSDSKLVRLIDRRMQDRLPVTLDWLEENAPQTQHGNEAAQLAALMQRLERSIDEFGKTSLDAHRATSEYNTALEVHLGELDQVTRAGSVISELATIAKVMLRRTQDIEKQMQRSEAQTRALRRRLKEARRNAEHDHLTGLPNRRAFEARYEEEHRQAFAASEQLCLAFCDIDNFKRVNDSHGHDAGDRVIRIVAESLARISDERCHVARHGGEEFVVLFRDTSLEVALARLETLRQQLAHRRLVNRATEAPFGQVTFSAGIADVFAYPDRRTALKAADAALYRAKHEGRNRIVRAGPEDAAATALHTA
ncbi:MAG: GGDEF domain-containing protein [Sphingomonadales bacterium]|nr:GGDEF domain-containing protein [Sphingomonadales bacterium]